MEKRPKLKIESKDFLLLQKLLPLFSKDVTLINNLVGFAKRDNTVYYFCGQMPVFQHVESDLSSFKMFMSQLYIQGTATQSEINRTFGLNPINMKRWVKRYQEGGCGAFYNKKPRARNPRILRPEVLRDIQSILNEGGTPSEAARKLGIKPNTLQKAIRNGRLHIDNSLKKTRI